MRGQWEERFERRYGFWRGFVDDKVRRYLDCGLYENGFARVQCPDCHEEYLLAFSCKTRKLCPSCAARRAAAEELSIHPTTLWRRAKRLDIELPDVDGRNHLRRH